MKSEARLAMEKSIEGKVCPKCGKDLTIRIGPYGRFVGCVGYPECRHKVGGYRRKVIVEHNRDGGEDV